LDASQTICCGRAQIRVFWHPTSEPPAGQHRHEGRGMTTTPTARRPPAAETDHYGLDAALIRLLREDARASIQDLAEALGVSRDVVSQRLRMLTENEGLRIVAALDPGFAGHHVLVHARVDVHGPVAPVAQQIAGFPEPVFVSMVSGDLPLVFESRHGDLAELHDLLDRVRRIAAVRQIRVTTYAEVLKGFFVARRRSEIALDALDHEIIGILQQNGRASYRAISDAIHLSASSVRARVHRLVDAGAIRISVLKSGGISQSRLAIGLGITATGDAEPVRRFLLDSPDVDFAARCHGGHDFVATFVGSSSTQLLAAIDELRALPQVGAVQSWTHYDVVKEDYARVIGRVVTP